MEPLGMALVAPFLMGLILVGLGHDIDGTMNKDKKDKK